MMCSCKQSEEKTAIICETPFQILNALELAYEKKNQECCIDLFLGNNIRNVERAASNLRKVAFINNVYIYKRKSINKYEAVIYLIFTGQFLKSCLIDSDVPQVKKYDAVVASFLGGFPFYFLCANKKAKYAYLEDGLGAYVYGGLRLDNVPNRLWLLSLFGANLNRLREPEEWYVNNKELMELLFPNNRYLQLPLFGSDQELDAVVREVFECTEEKSQYRNKRIIYFTQPNDFREEFYEQRVNETLEALNDFNEELLIRVHPRDTFDRGDQYEVDQTNYLWEIIASEEITDNHILIGQFSTAQFTPKLMYDKEPWIIVINAENNTFLEIMMRYYRDKSKVIVLKDSKDLRKTIESIIG